MKKLYFIILNVLGIFTTVGVVFTTDSLQEKTYNALTILAVIIWFDIMMIADKLVYGDKKEDDMPPQV